MKPALIALAALFTISTSVAWSEDVPTTVESPGEIAQNWIQELEKSQAEKLMARSENGGVCQKEYDFCFSHRAGDQYDAWEGQSEFYWEDCSYDHKLCRKKLMGIGD